jgi:sugar/nucleoside kinase (ribokinase family)
MYQKISEKDEIELLDDFEKIIVTLWSKWSKIIDRSWVLYINPVEVENALDPTWAWDAYRAWLLKWLKLGFDLETSAKIWSVVSSYCVQFHWAQNHIVTKKIVKEDMKKHFKINIEL